MITLSNNFVHNENIYFYDTAKLRTLDFHLRLVGRLVFFGRRRHSVIPVSGFRR